MLSLNNKVSSIYGAACGSKEIMFQIECPKILEILPGLMGLKKKKKRYHVIREIYSHQL